MRRDDWERETAHMRQMANAVNVPMLVKMRGLMYGLVEIEVTWELGSFDQVKPTYERLDG